VISAMIISGPHAICPIFMLVPFMIVVVPFVVVTSLVIIGSQHYGSYCYRDDQGCSEYDHVQKMWHDCFHTG